MPPRGSEGLDFTPILTHYLFLFTSILSFIAWFLAFISQCIVTADSGRASVGTLWFAIFLQLFLILGVLYTLATDSIAMNRFQISVFGAVAIVFSVHGVDIGLFAPTASFNAMGAGWLLLAIVDILWVLYFTSEEDSLALHIFNMLGNGGLSSPSRRRRTRTQSVMHDVPSGNGYPTNYALGGGVSSYDSKIGAGAYGSPNAGGIRSQNSFGGSLNDNVAKGGTSGTGGPGSLPNNETESITNPNVGPSSPLMAGIGAVGTSNPDQQRQSSPQPDNYLYKAKALYAYTANSEDPTEISFAKGEILDIVDKQGKWWQSRRADGSTGIAPSNYLQII